MLITSSNVQLTSQRQASVTHIQRERLEVEIDNAGRTPRQPAAPAAARFVDDDRVSLSQPARTTAPEIQPPTPSPAPGPIQTQTEDTELDDRLAPIGETRLQALVLFVEQLTGKKMKLLDPKDLQADTDGPNPQRAGFRLEYEYYEEYREEEHTAFSAAAVVNTADGRQISIELALSMSRSFMETNHVQIRLGDEPRLKDPLVLNFNGNAAELTDRTFRFDLDADGTPDQISQLAAGSGFLALDKNGDGQINDGRELFGALSGDGFADLRAYDEDGNQWIDSGDSIFDKLRIWQHDGSSNGQLIGLGQTGVGAIYLGNINTPFDLKNNHNQLQGQVVSSGFYLNEDGTAGSVQQLNLVV